MKSASLRSSQIRAARALLRWSAADLAREAALGAKVQVPTLDGPVEMTIRPGTQGGQKLRLRGQGPNKRGGGRGDQYVKIKIVIPPKLTSKEKALFEKLAEESRFNARDLMTV